MGLCIAKATFHNLGAGPLMRIKALASKYADTPTAPTAKRAAATVQEATRRRCDHEGAILHRAAAIHAMAPHHHSR